MEEGGVMFSLFGSFYLGFLLPVDFLLLVAFLQLFGEVCFLAINFLRVAI